MESASRKSGKRFPHIVLVRVQGLLPMQYKAKELAEELGIHSRTLRDWLSQGAPHHRDRRGHLWVDDHEFAKWVETHRRRPRRVKLANDEAFCLRCNRPVRLANPETIPIMDYLVNIRGTARTAAVSSIADVEMINRDNYLLIKSHLKYLEEVEQISPPSLRRYRWQLRHRLIWADEPR